MKLRKGIKSAGCDFRVVSASLTEKGAFVQRPKGGKCKTEKFALFVTEKVRMSLLISREMAKETVEIVIHHRGFEKHEVDLYIITWKFFRT